MSQVTRQESIFHSLTSEAGLRLKSNEGPYELGKLLKALWTRQSFAKTELRVAREIQNKKKNMFTNQVFLVNI